MPGSSPSNAKLEPVQPSILWRQVWGLAMLLAAILFCWMAYGFYQPKILQNLGFSGWANHLGILQGLLGAVIEPFVGSISDQVMQRVGSRLPMITVGVTLAGAIFVVSSALLQGQLPPALHWLVPLLMTLWVMAMIVFRGPAIALLRQFAPTTALPKANAILVIVFGLVGALGPLISLLLQSLGAALTFLLGAFVLLGGALLLRSANPQYQIVPIADHLEPGPSLVGCGAIFGVGLGAGLQVDLLLRIVPTRVQMQLPGVGMEWLAAGILLVCALAAVPLERLTVALGVKRAMLASLGAIAICLGLSLLVPHPILAIGLLLASGVALGWLFITQIPFALAMVAPTRAGLGTGLYFGGMGAALALVSLLAQETAMTPVVWGGSSAIALLLSWFSLNLTGRTR